MTVVGSGGWTLQFTGLIEMMNLFLAGAAGAKRMNQEEYFVGTIIYYAVYQHFGTKKIQGIPFLTIALERVADRYKGDAGAADELIQSLFIEDDSSLEKIALEVEREVKLVITEHKASIDRLIDTGTMRASFAAGPSIPEAGAASKIAAESHIATLSPEEQLRVNATTKGRLAKAQGSLKIPSS